MGTTITKAIECGDCGKVFPITMTQEGYEAWIMGELIQRALPEVSIEDRELLISRTCGKCFDKLFSLPE